jgi:hypothetical protein
MLHFLSNIFASIIWDRTLRDKVRVMIRYPKVFGYIRFVRQLGRKYKKCNIQTRVGRGCHNFVVILNKKFVFKFPLLSDGKAISEREKRITDALRPISPIKIPAMEIIPYKNIFVRKYEFAHGTLLSDVKPKIIRAHRSYIAKQIANMIYVIGKSDPKEIRDLKTNPDDKPGYLYGWFQDDIWQNFMIDEKTFDITFFIDWEGTKFQSFLPAIHIASRTWEKRGYKYMGIDVLSEYSKLYFQNTGK